jgi:thiamine-phosphate diphosphorylase
MARGLQGLYVIVDPEFSPAGVLATAEAALKGGARMIQWRDKFREKGLQLPECREIARMCERYDSLLIVNDHADLTLAAGAHGLHVGQKDLPVDEARSIMPTPILIGTSNATLEEAIDSQQLGADYIAVGRMFPTATKTNTRPAGLETLRAVRQVAQVPVVAIGGITEGNIEAVVEAGADLIAVISSVTDAPDPACAARRLTTRILAALERYR